MKRLHQAGNSVVHLEEVPVPEPGPGEVLIETRISALCGSELGTFRGAGRPAGNLGHEAAGVVKALGAGAEAWVRVGQRVGVSAIAGCGDCEECRAGRYTWCEHFTFHDCMHAEYFKLPAWSCHALPDWMDWESGVLVSGDGLGVPYHSHRKFAGPEVTSVAVLGLGPIGLGHVVMQRHFGRTVIGVDRSPERLALAAGLGAIPVQAADDAALALAVAEANGGRRVDVAIEAAGRPETAKACFRLVRTGGRVVFNGEQPAVTLSPSDDFIRRDITAVGSWFYHFHEFADMARLVEGGLPAASIITHRFPLERGQEAFDLMAAGRTGKAVFTYG